MGREEWEEQESGEDQHSEAASVESGSFSGSVLLDERDQQRERGDKDEEGEEPTDAAVSHQTSDPFSSSPSVQI